MPTTLLSIRDCGDIFASLSRSNGKDWSFAKYFHATNYIEFKHTLDKEKQERCKNVSYGTVFTEDPNGFVFSSPFGPCSVCSTAVKWLSKFSTLALIDFGNRVPFDVQWRSLIIATRLALGTESYDFEMDPRGIIPSDFENALYRPYPFQSIFIAGHEYGHYLLGNLDENNTTKTSFSKPHFKDDNDYRKIDTYNISQKHEFDADLFAMNEPRMEDRYYNMYYHSVMLWFASQVIFETVEDTICPPYGYQSHPGAKARYKNIIENARKPKDFGEKYYCERLPKLVDSYSEKIRDFAMSNMELFEFYGSFYLAEPNTKWRGRELIDRVDY